MNIELINKLKAMCSIWEPVGSTVTCVPIPEGADNDILALITDPREFLPFIGECVQYYGFTFDGSEVENSDQPTMSFVSLTHPSDNTNLIITRSKEFATKFLVATHVCKTLNLLDKNHRILVFQAVLYGNIWDKPS